MNSVPLQPFPGDEYPLCDFLSDLKDATSLEVGRRYCFILGSGASVASGIPTGETLVTSWLRELFQRRHPNLAADGFKDWATASNLGLPGFSVDDRASFYGRIYKLRFASDATLGQDYLRKKLRPAKVSFGYSVLAKILTRTPNRLVVTTNFDHLIEDSLSRYTTAEAQVCGHEELAEFLGRGADGPIVAKIHGDLFLKTYNTDDDLEELREQWKAPLKAVFRNYTPVVVGYGGNDPGFMRFLAEGLEHGTFAHAPIWTYRYKPSAANPTGRPSNPRVKDFVEAHRGRYVAIPGFDEFMLLLGDVFDIPKLDREMELEAASRVQSYRDELTRTISALKEAGPIPGSPQLMAWTAAVIDRLLSATPKRDWYEWYLATKQANPADAEGVFKAALDALPESPGLRACYAAFLARRNPRENAALQSARQALSDGRASLGADHPETLMAAEELAQILRRRGEFDEAASLSREALETRERVLGPEHPDTLASVNNLANLLADQGDRAAAEPLYRRALETRERVLGPEHRDTLTSVNNLATLLAYQGDRAAAEPLHRQALETQERVLGPEHPDTLRSISNLAILLAERGDGAGAEPLHRRALEARERVLGPEHPDTLTSVNNLAVLLANLGDGAGAELLHRRALDARERVLGPEHPDTLASVANLAILLADKGDFAGAEPLHRRALETQERVLGPEHPDTLRSVLNLAMLLASKGDLPGAEPLARRALETQERVLGPEHPDTLRSVNNLAVLLEDRGDRAWAEALYRRALETQVRVVGPEHHDTLRCVNNLAILLANKGDLAGAKAVRRRVKTTAGRSAQEEPH